VNTKTASLKIKQYIRAGLSAALLPVFIIYLMLDKPDYKLIDALGRVVVPAVHFTSNVAAYPLIAIWRGAKNIRGFVGLRHENRELRAALDTALASKTQCDLLTAENDRLSQELGIIRQTPGAIARADVIGDNTALDHSELIINRGSNAGIAVGDYVLSMDGSLVGIVSNVTSATAAVRGLSDSKSNIVVRVNGSDVYGFLRGAGRSDPVFEFFSDPEFTPTPGIRLVTSGVHGGRDGIMVGIVERVRDKTATVQLSAPAGRQSAVLIVR